jgi:ectoine hydroxylase-related dioxygenase (phytanoyl-CoA dioxygenase family)
MHQRAFLEQGFTIIPGVVSEGECGDLPLHVHQAGEAGSRRLLDETWCMALAMRLCAHPQVAPLVPDHHVVVQCTAFEKSVETNWLVPVHQDLSIPVHARVDHPDLSGWSEKEGVWYVQPPVELLQQLVAVRLHLDDCGEDDGPLRVVPGSHLLGRIDAEEARSVKARCGEASCPAPRGAAMVMRPLLLHASSKARGTSRRRVLHFLFGPRELPHGLRWQAAG